MNTTILSHNFTGKSLVMVGKTDGKTKTYIVQQNHPHWNTVVELYTQKKYDEVFPLLDLGQAIGAKFKGFSVRAGKVYYGDAEAHGYLIDRILFFLREMPGQAERLIKFANNLYSNPDARVRDELYKFLEHKHMPITDDGCFLAYKGVQQDYYSITKGNIEVIRGKVQNGKIFNGVGEDILVKRSDVCANSYEGCARGIHAGSWDYANSFRNTGRLMVVKLNPKDVVSVPSDCNFQKLRTCAYIVVGEENEKLDEKYDGDFDKTGKSMSFRDKLGRFAKALRDRFN